MEPMSLDEIKNRFGFHPATEETKTLHQKVRQVFIDTAYELRFLVPPGREWALVMTALEESSMWANAGVARTLAPLKWGE